MKREYAAHECELFSAEINEMVSIASGSLRRSEKVRQLERGAKRILAKNEEFTGKKIPPVAVLYQLKNWKGGEEKFREVWINVGGQSHDYDVMKALKLSEPGTNIEHLPECSWMLTIEFTLASPYTSRDDNPFYMLDNPLRREKVFKVPYIAPSQWKGMLRASLSYRLAEMAGQLGPMEFARQRFLLTMLFGDEKGEEEGKCSNLAGFLDKACKEAKQLYRNMVRDRFNLKQNAEIPSSRGNFHFYPTYFYCAKTSFEIINPHSRVSGAGTIPFYLETVPAGTRGKMALLYVPLYTLTGSEPAGNALEYFKLVAQGLSDLFIYYGLGAKTSTGFGTIKTEEKIDGTFMFNSLIASKETSGESEQAEKIPKDFQQFFDENGQINAVFLNSNGEFYSNKNYKAVSEKTGISLSTYKLFREWYQKHGETEKTDEEQVAESGYRFSSLKEILELPLKLLRREGE